MFIFVNFLNFRLWGLEKFISPQDKSADRVKGHWVDNGFVQLEANLHQFQPYLIQVNPTCIIHNGNRGRIAACHDLMVLEAQLRGLRLLGVS